jgi:hypothetical protein
MPGHALRTCTIDRWARFGPAATNPVLACDLEPWPNRAAGIGRALGRAAHLTATTRTLLPRLIATGSVSIANYSRLTG